MRHAKKLLWSIALIISCSVPSAAQPTNADPAYANQHCEEYYGCIAWRHLSEAEARASRGYPASAPPQAETASRDTTASGETRSTRRPVPIDLFARQLPRGTTF